MTPTSGDVLLSRLPGNKRPSIGLFLVLSAALSSAALLAVRLWPLGSPRRVQPNDGHDINVYIERGIWLPERAVPYRDVFSEYPEFATWLLGVPYALSGLLTWVTGIEVGSESYRYIFTAIMGIFLAGTITLLHAMLTERRWMAFLMLLPSCWYFAHNRFDVVPAFLVVAALYFFQRGKFSWAVVWLGVATMSKWYPAVVLPIFLSFLLRMDRRVALRSLALFFAVVASFIAVTLVTAGVNGFLVPYEFHLSRSGNSQSLFTLLDRIDVLDREDSFPRLLFVIMMFLPALLSLFVRIVNWRLILAWSAMSVLTFIVFNSIYSPQWILWVAPFLILLSSWWEAVLLLMYNISNMAMFPFFFYNKRAEPEAFVISIAFNLLVIIAILIRITWIAYVSRIRLLTLQHDSDNIERLKNDSAHPK
ncbi:MAG: hypothetical protein CMH41_10105 [Micrococcales bacterium]|nr:hypothetical protein [Micrococcales bacterium]